MSFSDILDDLQFGAMAGYAGTNGRFVVLADAVVANLGKTRRGEGGVVRSDVDVDMVILEGDFGYAVSDGFQLFGGVRWFSLTSKLDLRVGQFERRARSDQDWVDPLVGFRVGTARGDRWSFWLRGDVGGFGVGSDLTWNAVAAFSYQFNDTIGIGAGYRYMDIDYDDGSGNGRFLFDARLDGPVAGVIFSF
jgi:opacity protein-like surface antigen